MDTCKKNENGSIIVEASLCFPFFMFIIIMFLSLIDICMTQAKIATALNVAAKEISQYSYLYILTGANSAQQNLYQAGQGARTTVNNTLDGLDTITETLLGDKTDIVDGEIDLGKLSNDINAVGSTANDIYKDWGKQLSDPKTFIKSIAAVMGNIGAETAKTQLVGEVLAKAFMVKNLKTGSGTGSNFEQAEAFLRSNHIVPKGDSYLAGLDFGDTIVFKNGENERIQLVCAYEIHVVKLLNIDFNFKIQQCALTKAWGSGIKAK